jgi:predicted flap endonuclease-1-like 5' DNA nuclease
MAIVPYSDLWYLVSRNCLDVFGNEYGDKRELPMHNTARNLSALGLGLSISALVGWLLLRENKRVRELSAITVKSRSRDTELDEVPAIPLPMEPIEERDPVASTSAEDDLTQIDGIGRTFADALHAIGIRRFEQLAKQTPDDLAGRLAQHTTVTAQRIRNKDWIGQAQRLAKA